MRYSFKNYKRNYPDVTMKGCRGGEYPCFYCGLKSESVDHFIPSAYIENIRLYVDIIDTTESIKRMVEGKQELIPACKQCNGLASDAFFDTPDEKKAYIKAKLKKRYAKIIALPEWRTEEKAELGYLLRTTLEQSLSLKELVIKRILW